MSSKRERLGTLLAGLLVGILKPLFRGLTTTASGYVTIDPTNTFLYSSNPNNSSISASTINTTNGVLTQVGGTPLGVGTNPAWIAVSIAQDEP